MSARLLHDETPDHLFCRPRDDSAEPDLCRYALAANPQVTERLHAELDRVLAGRVPTSTICDSFRTPLQVVKEVLRATSGRDRVCPRCRG